MRSSPLAVGATEVVEDGAKLRLHARAVFLCRFEQSLPLIARGFEFLVLRYTLEVSDARTLERKWLLVGLSRSVVTHQPIRALPKRVVREIWFPLDHCRPFPLICGRRQQRGVDVGRLSEHVGRHNK